MSSVSESQRAEVLITMNDVTNRKKAEEEKKFLLAGLEEALKARDEFLSIASHELRTPLTPMALQVEMLEDFTLNRPQEDWDKEEILRALRLFSENLQKMNDLIEDLVSAVKYKAGKFETKKGPADLVKSVERVTRRFSEQLKQSGSELSLDLPDEANALFDPKQIDTLCTNLLTNAMKYGKGGKIEISVGSDKQKVWASFTDHGVGISESGQKKIFERFERSLEHADFSGLGLGLYICKSIVDGHNGKITVSSSPGKGSTFYFELPVAAV